MKRRDLERFLKVNGWRYLRAGGSHDVWTNGREIEAVPRHREVNEFLARKIMKTVLAKPGKTEDR